MQKRIGGRLLRRKNALQNSQIGKSLATGWIKKMTNSGIVYFVLILLAAFVLASAFESDTELDAEQSYYERNVSLNSYNIFLW